MRRRRREGSGGGSGGGGGGGGGGLAIELIITSDYIDAIAITTADITWLLTFGFDINT